MATPDAAVQRVASALVPPDAGGPAVAGTMAVLLGCSVEAARQFGVFLDRVADLTPEEFRELHEATFGPPDTDPRVRLFGRLAEGRVTPEETDAVLATLTPALDELGAARNPFAYAVRALCCLLLNGPVGRTDVRPRATAADR